MSRKSQPPDYARGQTGGTPQGFSGLAPPSELEFQPQLNQPWRLRCQNLVEGWRTDVAVEQGEVRVVQEVEELGAEGDPLPSAAVMFLQAEKSHVAGSLSDVASGRAELRYGRTRIGRDRLSYATPTRGANPLPERRDQAVGSSPDRAGPSERSACLLAAVRESHESLSIVDLGLGRWHFVGPAKIQSGLCRCPAHRRSMAVG